jgi:hypothetical protein
MSIDKCLEGGMLGMICCMNIYIYIYKYIPELENDMYVCMYIADPKK